MTAVAVSTATVAGRTQAAPAVRRVGDESAADWNAFVASAAEASLYHRYEWRRVVQRVFGRETHYLAAYDGARMTGVLPLVRLNSRLFGNFLVSLPYVNYGGALFESPEAARLLVDHARDLGVELGVSHIELRHRSNAFESLPVRTDKVAMLLPMPPTSELLWKSVGSKVRAQIKQGRRAGAECVRGAAELLDDFYAVFAENMRDLGTPVYPRRFFQQILEAFPVATNILVVRLNGQPVAAGFLMGDGRTLEIPWASSLRRANRYSVNMLLYWHALEFACEQKYAAFDFGRCTVDSGTYAFKKQWGAQPAQLYWHYWMRGGGEPPRLNHSNPKFGAAVALWRRLPLFVANRLGPMLIGNLP